MRFLLLLPCILATTPSLALSPPEQCAEFADKFGERLPMLSGLLEAMEETEYWKHIEGRGDLKQAVETADATRSAIVPPLRNYLSAMEDLTYQLQRCARQ